MLVRLGIRDRREFALLFSVVLLVAVTPLGKEATHPVVLGLYRSLLVGIVLIYAASKSRLTLPRICPYFLLTVAAVVSVMLVSVVRVDGSRFEGFYAFYEKVLFIGAFLAVAHTATSVSSRAKRLILASVVVINMAYMAGAMIFGGRPLIGPFVNANYFASFMLPGLAVCAAAVCLESSLKIRFAAAACGLFLYYGIIRTSSRGATLAGLAMLALVAFRASRRYGVSLSRLVLAGALIAAITLAANASLINKFLDRGEQDPFNYQRGKIWMGTLQLISEHPILGVGLRQYYYVAKRFTPPVEGNIARYLRWPNIAHSEYLQHIAEIGIPAALTLFLLGGYLISLAWRRAVTADPDSALFQDVAIAAAAGLSIHALVDNNWTAPVIAAGMAVISQASLLPYRGTPSTGKWPPAWRAAFILLVCAVWVESTLVPSIGLYFNEKGHLAYEQGNFVDAERMHRFALSVIPEHPVLLDNLGMLYLEEFTRTQTPEYLDRAEILFGEAMAQSPNFDVPPSHMEVTLIHRLTGDPGLDRAIHAKIVEIDRRVLRVNPFNPLVRKNLAEALHNMGNHEEAFLELRKALEFEPNFVPAYLRLAEWYEADGRTRESEEYRQRGIEVVMRYQNSRSIDPMEDVLLGRPSEGRREQ